MILAFARARDQLKTLIELAATSSNDNQTVEISKVTPEQAQLLEREGLSVSESFVHTADLNALRHAIKSHGEKNPRLREVSCRLTRRRLSESPRSSAPRMPTSWGPKAALAAT